MRSQKLRLQRHQVAIPRCKMDNRLDTKVILEQTSESNATHAHTRHWAIGNVNTMHTHLLKHRSTLKYLSRIQALWRIELNTYYKFSRG